MKLTKLSNKRIFDFTITNPYSVDKVGDVVPSEEIGEALDAWLLNSAPIIDYHTNRVIGKGVRWFQAPDGKIVGRGLINEGPTADIVWEKIRKGEYKSVSIGGAAFEKTPNAHGGFDLNGLDILEVSVCPEGAHQDANIIGSNSLAKSEVVMKAMITVNDETDAQDSVIKDAKSTGTGSSPLPNYDNHGGSPMTTETLNVKKEDMAPVAPAAPAAAPAQGNETVISLIQALAQEVAQLKEMMAAKPAAAGEAEMSKTIGYSGSEITSTNGAQVNLEGLNTQSEKDTLTKAVKEAVASEMSVFKKSTTPLPVVERATAPKMEIPAWEIIKGRKKAEDYARTDHVAKLERRLAMEKEFSALKG